MKLVVRVIEAKNIPAMDPNGFSDPYVKLKLGRQRQKSKVVKKCLNPSWCEEFTFRVDDLKKKLKVSVLDEKYFNDDCVGRIKLPISQVFETKDQSLGTTWYKLRSKNRKAKNKDCGEILLTICLLQKSAPRDLTLSKTYTDCSHSQAPSFAGRIAQIFNKNVETTSMSSGEATDASEAESETSVEQEQASSVDFEEKIRRMEMREQGGEVPSPLSGGVVLDTLYGIAPRELNSMLFSPNSDHFQSYADKVGSTDLQVGLWKLENGGDSLRRVVSYTKPPSKLVKALKATEEQTYLKADDGVYAVFACVSTPDAPCGKTFKTEVLYCMTPGPEHPSGELSSRLVVSWRMNFVQSTMMRGMIENGARQGIKESFEQYEKLLSQKVKPLLDLKDSGSEKSKLLADCQVETQSIRKLSVEYFANFTVISTLFMGLYVLTHLWLVAPSAIQGLEFVGLDLPDSIGEMIVCGVLVLQGRRVLELISCFLRARVRKVCDHGIKAQGAGWLLTVALIEGRNLAAVDESGLSNPFVVFTCNGKSRTSSVKFQKSEPLWNGLIYFVPFYSSCKSSGYLTSNIHNTNVSADGDMFGAEIFEFDAMDEPPSTLDVQVLGFDGQFHEATSIGRAEINFLKSNISDLSGIWIPLQGQLAQACQSKLHLRIFLNNTKGSHIVKDYLSKMEKEVGKKIKLRSPQTNSAFQKLFGLPPEEFLVNDFACHLKRKMPLQGRLFLSARMVGFHADLFGHKTKFFFLWEDIESIQVTPPTLSSMGSPIIIMMLRPGRGFDARNGARKQDAEGRLNFHFHSFVSFNVAQRTIMALWRARPSTTEQKVRVMEEESEANDAQTADEESEEELDAKSHLTQDEECETGSIQTDETTTFLGAEDVPMSTVYSSILSIPITFFMELFKGKEIEQRVMEGTGCLNYTYSRWLSERLDVHQRQVHYTFDKLISHYGAQVSSIQQKSQLSGTSSWLIEEAMSLHGVPLYNYFTIHLRYQVEDLPLKSGGCSIRVYLGIAWLKYPRCHKKITKSIKINVKKRVKVMLTLLEKEYSSRA